ncbi:MAG: O-methyltransferase [Phycisphaerales bacterium]
MDMTPERWVRTSAYLDAVFTDPDERLSTLMERAVEAGLPDIAVSPSVGRLLTLLARLVDARTIVEVGTLGGYSGIWLARGLAKGGRLLTIEPEALHADFARREFDAAGVGERVEIIPGFGLDILPRLVDELGESSVDLVFLDGIKTEYPGYAASAKRLLRPGGLLVADNALGGGDWWIDDKAGAGASRDAVDGLNRALAGDDVFDAACVPIREGVLIARKR